MLRYSRKLSPVERFSLALNKTCSYNICSVVEGDGNLTADRLRAAVKQAAEVNPGMRVRLRSFLGFTKWVDSGIDPVVQERINGQWDGRSDVAAEFLEEGFNALGGGPISDILLFRGTPTRIVFRAAHAAIDGRGMKHWMDDVFRALRGEPLLGAPATEREIDVMEKYRDKIPDAVKAKKNPAVAALPVVPPSLRAIAKLRYVWRNITIGGDPGNVLSKTAAFVAAYARRQGNGPVVFTVPVDLRSARCDLLSTGNLTAYLSIAVAESDTPRMVMKQINQQLRDYMDCIVLPMIYFVSWVPISLLYKGAKNMLGRALYNVTTELPTGGLVSFGMVRNSEFSCPEFRASYVVAVPGFVGKLNVVLMNQSTHMSVTIAVPEAYNVDGQLDEFVVAFRNHFEKKENVSEVTEPLI